MDDEQKAGAARDAGLRTILNIARGRIASRADAQSALSLIAAQAEKALSRSDGAPHWIEAPGEVSKPAHVKPSRVFVAPADGQAEHDRRIYEQGRRDACEDHDIAPDSRAGDAGEGFRAVLERWDSVIPLSHDERAKLIAELTAATPAPAVDAVEKLTLNPTPLEKMAADMTGGDPVNDMAIRLMRAWAKADPRSGVAQYPASYVANFACMAADAVASAVDAVPAGEVIKRLDAWLAAEQIDESTSPQNGEDFPSWSSGYLTAIDLTRQRLAALSHGEMRGGTPPPRA